MANLEINDLTNKATPVSTDEVEIQETGGGTSKKATLGNLKNGLGLVKADVGLGNVDNTSDATKNSASATLTNKTIDGDNNTIQDLPYSSVKQTAWSTWTPTFTNVTIGNGSVTARYVRIGNMVQGQLHILAGSTTSFGNSIEFSLPITAASYHSTLEYVNIGTVVGVDSGSSGYHGSASTFNSTTVARIRWDIGSSFTSLFRYAEASGDTVSINFMYEAA